MEIEIRSEVEIDRKSHMCTICTYCFSSVTSAYCVTITQHHLRSYFLAPLSETNRFS